MAGAASAAPAAGAGVASAVAAGVVSAAGCESEPPPQAAKMIALATSVVKNQKATS